MAAKKMSSCRQSTPLGIPVVPRAAGFPGLRDLQQRTRLAQGTEGPFHRPAEAAVEDEADQGCILVEVLQLAGDVAVVDVDGNGADLEAGEHALDVLGAVGELEADPIARTDPGAFEAVGKSVGALVQLGVAEPAAPRYHRRLLSDLIDHALEEIGEIELHGPPGWSRGGPGWARRVAALSALTLRT